MKRLSDSYIFLPIAGLLLGLGLPLFIFDVQFIGPKSGIGIGFVAATLMIITKVCWKIGKKNPGLSNWVTCTLSGSVLLFFCSCFIATTVGVMAMLAPMPTWLGYIFVFCYLVYAIYYWMLQKEPK